MLGVLKTTLFNLGLTEEEENRLQELVISLKTDSF